MSVLHSEQPGHLLFGARLQRPQSFNGAHGQDSFKGLTGSKPALATATATATTAATTAEVPTSSSTLLPVENATNSPSNLVFTPWSCRFVSEWLDEAVKIFMQVFFVVTFLSLFFFLYVVNVEKEIFETQIRFVVDTLWQEIQDNMDNIIPVTDQQPFKEWLKKFVEQMHVASGDYASIRQQNAEVLNSTKNIVLTLGVILFAIAVALIILRFCTDLSHQVAENLFVLGGIALTEYLFLHLVGQQYIAADPVAVKRYFFTAVQQYAQQKLQEKTRVSRSRQ